VVGASLIDHNFNDAPHREIKTHKLARADKSVTTSAEYSEKRVTVTFILRGCERSDTESVMSSLKSLLRTINQELKVSQSGADTIYKSATLESFEYRWVSNKMIITLSFVVADPISYEDATRTMLTTTVTSSSSSNNISNDGSFDAEPIISLSYTSITGGTAQELSVKNEETNQGLTLSGNFASSDSIQINVADKTVIKNGALIDFSGQFPVFKPGLGVFGYNDTFTTRNVDISVTYVKRDL